jgi:hypothetical protein
MFGVPAVLPDAALSMSIDNPGKSGFHKKPEHGAM